MNTNSPLHGISIYLHPRYTATYCADQQCSIGVSPLLVNIYQVVTVGTIQSLISIGSLLDHSYLHFDLLTCFNLSWTPSGTCSQYTQWQINCHLILGCLGMFGILEVTDLWLFLVLSYFLNLVSVELCSRLFHRYHFFVASMFTVNNLTHCYWFWWTTANKKDEAQLSRHVLPYIKAAADKKITTIFRQ